MTEEPTFARLVSLACHDLRTPLAAVGGFARTIPRVADLGEPAGRYLELIHAASSQMAEILEQLAVVARIEAGRYDPLLQEVDSLELASGAAELVDRGELAVSGTGRVVTVDPEPTQQALAALAACALRHGRVEKGELAVAGTEIALRPIRKHAGPIIIGEEARDFGAAAAARLLAALGGSIRLEGDALLVELPAATSAGATAGGL